MHSIGASPQVSVPKDLEEEKIKQARVNRNEHSESEQPEC